MSYRSLLPYIKVDLNYVFFAASILFDNHDIYAYYNIAYGGRVLCTTVIRFLMLSNIRMYWTPLYWSDFSRTTSLLIYILHHLLFLSYLCQHPLSIYLPSTALPLGRASLSSLDYDDSKISHIQTGISDGSASLAQIKFICTIQENTQWKFNINFE